MLWKSCLKLGPFMKKRSRDDGTGNGEQEAKIILC